MATKKSRQPAVVDLQIPFTVKLFSFSMSVIIALVSVAIIENMGYADDARKYLFGSVNQLGGWTSFSEDYYKAIKTLMMSIVFFFALYACFFALFFEAIAVAYFLITSRYKNPRVFISYKKAEPGAKLSTDTIALEVKTQLEQKGFEVFYFAFDSQKEHDAVNFDVLAKLRNSDALVAIPDPYLPSYVNAEIFSAVTLHIPVYIIKHTKDQKLPHTANSGHTVLLLQKLKKEKYSPLRYILRYVHRVWHTRLFIIGMPLTSFLGPFLYMEENEINLIKVVATFGLVATGLIIFNAEIEMVLLVVKLLVSLLGIVGAYVTMIEIYKRLQFQNVMKQSMITARKTYDYFVAASFPKEVLACIDKAGLER